MGMRRKSWRVQIKKRWKMECLSRMVASQHASWLQSCERYLPQSSAGILGRALWSLGSRTLLPADHHTLAQTVATISLTLPSWSATSKWLWVQTFCCDQYQGLSQNPQLPIWGVWWKDEIRTNLVMHDGGAVRSVWAAMKTLQASHYLLDVHKDLKDYRMTQSSAVPMLIESFPAVS